MKKILALLLIGLLVLAGGCSPTAAPSDASSSEPDSSAQASRPGNGDGAQMRSPGFPGGNRQNSVMGKIVAVSESEITVEVGTVKLPEGMPNRGESRPNMGDAPPNGERPSDASMPQGGPPSGAGPGGIRGGGAFNGEMELEYTGEQASYLLTDAVTVTKDMGESSETLSIADLAEGDVVQLIFDETVQLVSIQVLDPGENDG